MKYFDIKKATLFFVGAMLITLFAISCSSSDSDSASSTATSAATTTSGSTATDNQSSVSTPANFETILAETISPALSPTLKTSVANLDRVLIKYSTSYLHLDNSTYAVGINSTLSTYNDVFLKTFQLVARL